MATGKQVENLAKQLANLVAKIDIEQNEKVNIYSQEASNQAYLEEVSKKQSEIINI